MTLRLKGLCTVGLLAGSVLVSAPAAMAADRHRHHDSGIARAILGGVIKARLEDKANRSFDYRFLNNLGGLGKVNVPTGSVIYPLPDFSKLGKKP